MNIEDEIPIFKKLYELYKLLHEFRYLIPKQDRFTIYAKTEDALLEIIESILKVSRLPKNEKLKDLRNIDSMLDMLRIFMRLLKDTKALDNKKYILIEKEIDEIGRMLGGWIRSLNN